jgi:hypothetical protein
MCALFQLLFGMNKIQNMKKYKWKIIKKNMEIKKITNIKLNVNKNYDFN